MERNSGSYSGVILVNARKQQRLIFWCYFGECLETTEHDRLFWYLGHPENNFRRQAYQSCHSLGKTTAVAMNQGMFSSASELERYWCAFCVKSPSWNASSLFCCCAFCRCTWWLSPRNLPAFTFSFCIFALIDPAHDIFHTASFSAMCCYLNFLADFCWSVSSSKLNWLIYFWKYTGSGLYSICACAKSDEKYVTVVIRMRTLCKQIFASAERKFNTIISSLDERYLIHFLSGSTLMQECFKNIKWRDADKKIRRWSFMFLET